MDKVTFGKTGLQVTPIALGGWPFGVESKSQAWDPYSDVGKATALETIETALNLGVNYIDTAPSYGDGNSESLIGQVMARRRSECVLATKVRWQGLTRRDVEDSVHASLERLQTDAVDVIQFHGGAYTREDTDHILHGGPLDALEKLRKEGKVRYIGVTAEEPFSILDLVRTDRFDVAQIAYNLIYQAASLHVLGELAERNIGVISMRTMTSGIFQRLVKLLVPGGEIPGGTYELCLRFLLADSRLHVANIGMRWPDEVKRNVDVANTFVPPSDLAEVPRSARGIYRVDDSEAAARGGA
jgi:aryl-alcohol dehydrogenase-like predicted oxidoreductase